jgi:hypothetical protein
LLGYGCSALVAAVRFTSFGKVIQRRSPGKSEAKLSDPRPAPKELARKPNPLIEVGLIKL